MQVARRQVHEGGDQDQEVTDGLPLVERVGEHRDEEGRHEAPVPEPHHGHAHQQGVQEREHVDQPEAVPAPLGNEAGDRVEHRRAAGEQHHRGWPRLDDAGDPPQDADEEPRSHHDPAAPVRAGDGFEIPEPLLDARRIVLPAADPCGQRLSEGRDAWRRCHVSGHSGHILHSVPCDTSGGTLTRCPGPGR